MTVQELRQRVGRNAVRDMRAAFRLYEKMEANFWHTDYHGWKYQADNLAKSAESGFELSRRVGNNE